MTDLLFAQGVSTVAVGHDHRLRIEPRLQVDLKTGGATRADVIDSGTWTNRIPGKASRDTGFTPNERRSLITITFDATGSHARLKNYDPQRGIQAVSVVESEAEGAQ